MKALHVITGLAAGGAETQLRLLLQHTRHDADVVALYNAGSVAGQLRADGVRVEDLGMSSNRQLGAVGRLVRLMREGRYDVVHTHLYRACVYGRVAARLAGVRRIVATEHSALDGQLEGRRATPAVRGLYRTSERLGSRTIAVSEAVERELVSWGIAQDRIVRIPNGLDLDALAFSPAEREAVRTELGIAAGAGVIGTVGRLHPGKRFDLLLEAAAPLLRADQVLVVVGQGPARAVLEAQAEQLDVSAFVRFVGERPAAPVLAAMDVFASPSPYETFGLALLEAVANGLPVVYRRCPALDELAGTTPTGADSARAIPTRALSSENPLELRAALAALLNGTGSAPTAVDRAAPSALEHYRIQSVTRAVDDCYEMIDGERPTSLLRSDRLS